MTQLVRLLKNNIDKMFFFLIDDYKKYVIENVLNKIFQLRKHIFLNRRKK